MLVTMPICVGQAHEGAVGLVRLDDHPFALAEARVGAPVLENAARDHRRVDASRGEDVSDERGRGRLAVRAGDRNGRIEPHQLGEDLGAANDGKSFGTRRLELGVAGLHSRRDDDRAGADEVDRIMADEHAHALGAQTPHVGAVLLVAALNRIALRQQYLGDGAHADAANADDVEGPELAGHLHGVSSLVPFVADQCRQLRGSLMATAVFAPSAAHAL